jgi:hypothetical protein
MEEGISAEAQKGNGDIKGFTSGETPMSTHGHSKASGGAKSAKRKDCSENPGDQRHIM